MLQLKGYQQRALDALRDYFTGCRKTENADDAFYQTTRKWWGRGIPYHNVEELPGLPYVCLRIPTGGGKTLMACHAAGIAQRELLGNSHNVILWLVPSNAIKEQTLKALRDRRHHCREALEAAVGRIEVLDVSQALYLQKPVADGQTVVIVSTMQAFRVDDTEGRKVYEAAGELNHHFDKISPEQSKELDCYENGKPVQSLANVLKLRHPIVIVDEAHNARTELSFTVLARFAPSCILEFTATPDTKNNPSNILYRATAAELKAEEMIKIPIRLETNSNWEQLLAHAVSVRAGLEKKASLEQQQSGEYIRPVMLLQAQKKNKDKEVITPEILKRALIEDHLIPEEQIAIATGKVKELDGVNISEKDCPLRFVITVEALREGWDCPFAYILYTVAENYSSKAVEQILGRVLRMPNAKNKQEEELNHAYAYASSSHWPRVAASLADALIQNGFEKLEAKDLIKPQEISQPALCPDWEDDNGLFAEQITAKIPDIPADLKISKSVKEFVSVDAVNNTITIKGIMPENIKDKLQHSFEDEETKKIIDDLHKTSIAKKYKKDNLRKLPTFRIPHLAIKDGTFWDQLEKTHFMDYEWDLSKQDALLTEEEYNINTKVGQIGEIDVDKEGGVQYEYLKYLWEDMKSLENTDSWNESDLVLWLDRNIPHKDIVPVDFRNFLNKAILGLIDQRGYAINQLVLDKIKLRDAIEKKVDFYRQFSEKKACELLLFGEDSPVAVSLECVFEFDRNKYPYSSFYTGAYKFKKHYYPHVGELKDKGEEFNCAVYLDELPEIKCWVRNLERKYNNSFWFQTSTDRFYPDFVCMLEDGRYLVVEYKGEDRWSNEDSKEKRLIGEQWATLSNGQCLFIMPKGNDLDAIRNIIR
ncbi:MAG: DEAD/DEAH box helicase [Sedimentisphaeraceae bacterium JB056]